MKTIYNLTEMIRDAVIYGKGEYCGANGIALLEHDLGEIDLKIVTLKEKVEDLEDKIESYPEFCERVAVGHYLIEGFTFDDVTDVEELVACEEYEHWSRDDLAKAIKDLYHTMMGFKL